MVDVFGEVSHVTGLAWDACHLVTEEGEGPLSERLPRLLGIRESHFSKQAQLWIPHKI